MVIGDSDCVDAEYRIFYKDFWVLYADKERGIKVFLKLFKNLKMS
jgi:hypothetical protein